MEQSNTVAKPQSSYAPMGGSASFSEEQKRDYALQKKQERMDFQMRSEEKTARLLKSKEGFQTLLNIQGRFMSESARNVMLIYSQRPKATLIKTVKEWEELGGQVFVKDPHGKNNALKVYRKQEKDGVVYTNLIDVYDISAVKGVSNQAKTGTDFSERKFEEAANQVLDGLSSIYIDHVEDNMLVGRVQYDNEEEVIVAGGAVYGDAEKYFHSVLRESAYAWISWNLAKVINDDQTVAQFVRTDLNPEVLCAEYMVCIHLGLNVEHIRIGTAYQEFENMDASEFLKRFHYAKKAAQKIVESLEVNADAKK